MMIKKRILRTAASCLAAMLLLPAVPAQAVQPQAGEISRAAADYTGAGSAVAMIGAGFYTEHPVFAEAPPSPALTKEAAEAVLPGAYVSEKLPAVWDYAGGDADVSNSSFTGTAAASLAAGRYTGRGDTENEDGTVTHDASFAGSAPDAQLLLFKAAADYSVRIDPAAAAEAIRDAVTLGADVIWLDTDSLTVTEALRRALAEAKEAGVPVFVGTGDMPGGFGADTALPVTYTDRGTLTSLAMEEGITAVGAASDPYADVRSFRITGSDGTAEEIEYVDSCEDYFGGSFASLIAGQTLRLVAVPGSGRAGDYEGLDVSGAAVVVLRGEITFTEKVAFAAGAGAAAVIVADNGSGVSRMALEGAAVPAVMVDEAAGQRLMQTADAVLSVTEMEPSPASFSAAGISDDLLAAPAFLCEAQGVIAAIPPAEAAFGDAGPAYYASVSGTDHAAARAAGYAARAAQYARAAGMERADLLTLTASSARTVRDEEGDPLSPRTVGRGLLSDKGSYAAVLTADVTGAAVSLPGTLLYSSAPITVRLQNLSGQRRHLTLSVSVRGDSYTTSEDGAARLTGTSEILSGARAYLGDSYVNICTSDGNENVGRITLEPGETADVTVRVSFTEEARRALTSVFWNGFFADGTLNITDETGETAEHPFSAFFGEWDAAPLADAVVYDVGEPVLGQCRLLVRRFDESGNEGALPLGAVNPYSSMTEYDARFNLVDPTLLRYGWVELELYALRDIDRIEITFYDSQRREVFSRTHTAAVQKYLTGGPAVIPLWDFIASDNENYFFPDGEYSCEIRLSSSFGDAGDGVQYMGFTFTVDSQSPTVDRLSAYREDGRTYLSVDISDNEALLDIAVYDTVYTFGISGEAAIAGDTAASLVFDVTQYDAMDPLYVEVTDRTGSYTTVRLSPAQFEKLLSESEDGADSGENAA